jgi:hypothetical protein
MRSAGQAATHNGARKPDGDASIRVTAVFLLVARQIRCIFNGNHRHHTISLWRNGFILVAINKYTLFSEAQIVGWIIAIAKETRF